MSGLSRADRCAIFVIQVIACIAVLIGAVNWIRYGYSTGSLLSIGSGGIVTAIILLGLITSRGSSSSTSSPSRASADPPPKYRLTWRKEFLQSIPDDLKADLEKDLQLKGKKGKRRRKDNHRQVIWTSDIEAGVHRITPLEGRHPVRAISSPESDHQVSAAGRRPSNEGGPQMEIVHLGSPSGTVSSQRQSSFPGRAHHAQLSSPPLFGYGLRCPNSRSESSAPSLVSSGPVHHSPIFWRDTENADDGLPSYDQAKMWI